MDEILLNEPKKVSDVNHEATEFLESDHNENGLYQVENMIIDKAKEKIKWSKRALEYKSSFLIENRNKIIYIHDN